MYPAVLSPVEVLDEATPVALGQRADVFELMRRWQVFLEVSGTTSPSTRRQYRRTLLDFLADVLRPLQDLTEDDIVEYLAGIDGRGSRRGMLLRALKSYYRWAVPHGYSELDPVLKLRVKRPKQSPAPDLSPEDLALVLEAATKIDPRAPWALQLAYATGARVASLCALTAEDVKNGTISFKVAKGDKPYELPLRAKAEEAVRELLSLADFKPKMAVSRRPTLIGVGTGTVWKWAHEAGEAAGVPCWPHLLRHAFISRLAEAGVDLRTIIAVANWSDPSQFARYAHRSDKNIAAAMEIP